MGSQWACWNLSKVQQGRVQGPGCVACGLGQPLTWVQHRGWMDWEHPCAGRLRGTGEYWTWDSSVHLEPGKPGLHQKFSWEVKGGDYCLVGLEYCVHLCGPQHKKHVGLLGWKELRKDPQKSSEVWSASPMRRIWESVGFSVRRKEDTRETLEQPFNIPGVYIREL